MGWGLKLFVTSRLGINSLAIRILHEEHSCECHLTSTAPCGRLMLPTFAVLTLVTMKHMLNIVITIVEARLEVPAPFASTTPRTTFSSWLHDVRVPRRCRCRVLVRTSALDVYFNLLQALGVGIFEDVSLLIRVVRLVIVAVGPQHARQVGASLVSVESCRISAHIEELSDVDAHRSMRKLVLYLEYDPPTFDKHTEATIATITVG